MLQTLTAEIERPRRRAVEFPTARVFRPLLRPARYKGAHGGRGSGKSHFFAEQLVFIALTRPTRAVCLREIQKSLKQSVKLLIEDKIRRFEVSHKFEILETHIRCPYDGIILFQGMQNHTVDSIKSLAEYNIAWFEEAQNCSARSLEILRPTMRTKNSEMWFSWNPNSPKDPVDRMLRHETPNNAIVVEANWEDNPWFPDDLYDDMEYDRRRDPERYKHVWMGEYRQHSQARVFKNWRIGDESEFISNPRRFYYGCDWGFSVDPTVAVRCYVIDRTLYIDREVYAIGCEIDRTPVLFDKLDGGQARKWPMTADSARPDTISYMNRHGYPRIQPAKKGKDSVEDGVEFLQSFDVVIHPDCKHTIDEWTNYSYKVDDLTNEVLPILEDKHNHVVDAARYAVESMRHGSTYTLDGVR